ncbi:MAG: glycosyltransferase family 4 protein [Lachnospiraceae bacterium]|nr:glycosyltransferase family 4 protein [Lachnospiraceae bacterium]
MKLTIVSNYINHHQIPMAGELYQKLGADFAFIQTSPMEADRIKMGWGNEIRSIPYLKLYYEECERCARLIMDSDIVVFGGVEDESYIKPRLAAGKIVIRASERLYREGQWKSVSPRGRKKKYEDHTRYADAPVYLLCHGAYVASDFQIVHAYPDKKFVWGYFPAVNTYNLDTLFFRKLHFDQNGRPEVRILWAGRFLKLKHPEYAIKAAKYLKQQGISFHLDMVGGGDLEEQLKAAVVQSGLEQQVTFHGFQPPQNVRRFMEESDIFLFTSNYLEGWGAVLNESMNSACAVVAGHGIGAVPFLIKHGQNGFVFRNGNFKEFREQVLELCKDSGLRKRLGMNAYQTMVGEWNPREAADRLYRFCRGLMEGKVEPEKEGPLSPAPLIAPREGYMYTKVQRGSKE